MHAKRFILALGAFVAISAGASVARASSGHAEGAPKVNWTNFSYKGKNVLGEELKKGEHGPEGTPMAPPLLLALLNFGIFAGLLYWKAGPAMRKYLVNRHETIKNALEEAAQLQAQARDKLDEYNKRISDADKEVSDLISQIRKEAEEERERIVADAQRQADLMKKEADARIESEINRAKRLLEAEVVSRAVEVAEKLIREKSTASDQGALFDTFISGISNNKPTSPAPTEGSADEGW
jgi:F-type H+-transporting ATPase subunit b